MNKLSHDVLIKFSSYLTAAECILFSWTNKEYHLVFKIMVYQLFKRSLFVIIGFELELMIYGDIIRQALFHTPSNKYITCIGNQHMKSMDYLNSIGASPLASQRDGISIYTMIEWLLNGFIIKLVSPMENDYSNKYDVFKKCFYVGGIVYLENPKYTVTKTFVLSAEILYDCSKMDTAWKIFQQKHQFEPIRSIVTMDIQYDCKHIYMFMLNQFIEELPIEPISQLEDVKTILHYTNYGFQCIDINLESLILLRNVLRYVFYQK